MTEWSPRTMEEWMREVARLRTRVERQGRRSSGDVGVAPSSAPAGSVLAFAGVATPTEYLPCNGASYATAALPALFAAIGYTYGGSGASFNVPNLQGRVPVGRDGGQPEFDALGETGGAKSHTLTAAEMPAHTHGIFPINYASVPQLNGSIVAGTEQPVGMSHNSGSAGGGAAHNNMQPYVILNYIIKT